MFRHFGACFDMSGRRLTSIGTDALLVLLVFSSWFLFPVMLKFLAYVEFQVGFALISIFVLAMLIRYSELNQLEWLPWHKWFVFFWLVYLLFLFSASFFSGSLYSLKQYCIIIYKVIFFAVLLIYMKRNFIIWSFRVYSNFMLFIVILASIVAIGIKFDLLHPIQYFAEKVTEHSQFFEVYWGAYYVVGGHRMQGFCEESGTFALTILPAFFWFIIVEKLYVRASFILMGVFFSHSTGGLWELILSLGLAMKKKVFSKNVLRVLLLATFILAIILSFSYLKALFSSDFDFFLDKIRDFVSLPGRFQSILSSYEYLLVHPLGTGNALGMRTVDYPISVGYANAMLEAGVIGGVSYLLMFALLFWKALKVCLSVNLLRTDGRVYFAVALTVMIVLLMGFQRQQPDLSMWHMWIYASFFYLTMKKREAVHV